MPFSGEIDSGGRCALLNPADATAERYSGSLRKKGLREPSSGAGDVPYSRISTSPPSVTNACVRIRGRSSDAASEAKRARRCRPPIGAPVLSTILARPHSWDPAAESTGCPRPRYR